MKLMPALPETIFDIGYLVFAITAGIVLLAKAKGRTYIKLFGAMTLIQTSTTFSYRLIVVKSKKLQSE